MYGLVPTTMPVAWCVFNSAEEYAEFKQRGATELGFATAFKTRATAERFAARQRTEWVTKQPTMLKLRTDLEGLVDFSFLSPTGSEEVLYPPGTYFELRSEKGDIVHMLGAEQAGRRTEIKMTHIEVGPQLPTQHA